MNMLLVIDKICGSWAKHWCHNVAVVTYPDVFYAQCDNWEAELHLMKRPSLS
jgi:hypothetical protein